jgi:hypothetical protein
MTKLINKQLEIQKAHVHFQDKPVFRTYVKSSAGIVEQSMGELGTG